ncbi:MAG: histidine kinase [Caldimonas sp.]
MNTREMLRLSWRAWLTRSEPRVGPWWIEHFWTVVFSLVIALAIALVFSSGHSNDSLATWGAWFGATAIVSLTIGFCVRGAMWVAQFALGRERLARLIGWRRSLYFIVVPFLGALVGWPLGMRLGTGTDVRRYFPLDEPGLLFGSIFAIFVVTMLFQQFFASKSRQILAENRATEAQLRLLQAQIEPHFLFNTLANVVSLMEVDAPRAKTMLEAFVDYLRASLSGLGHGAHTLGDEIDLVAAYMRIIKIRMEDRLDYSIEVPTALRAQPLPALTLQPLVENAIVHGLEPQIAGGRVRIGAESDGRSVVITVDDDGAGLAAAPARAPRHGGSGTALENIRLRLAQTYGSDASLIVRAAVPHGVRACLSLPALKLGKDITRTPTRSTSCRAP